MSKSYPTVCPQSLFSAANHFAMVIGDGREAEALTWRKAPWRKDGTRYGTYNLTLSEGAVAAASQPLVRPAWDTGEIIDMDAAAQCQAALNMVDVSALADGDSFPQPQPDRILLLINCGDIRAAVQAWGLEPVPSEDDDL